MLHQLLPSDTHILYETWDLEYQNDPVYKFLWPALRAEGMAGRYRLYEDCIWYEGRICIPLALLDKVIVATHAYAHPGIHKTHHPLDCKYIVHYLEQGHTKKYPFQKPKERITGILTSCKVRQSVKGRKGLQPEQLIFHPVPNTLLVQSQSILLNWVACH